MMVTVPAIRGSSTPEQSSWFVSMMSVVPAGALTVDVPLG